MSARVTFISHSSRDREVAFHLCQALERRGQACWISGRDVKPGQNFQEEIVRAIKRARAMVLVFSTNANNSNEIKKELALAGQAGIAVIPVRVEDVLPSDAFSYELATRQWIDFFEDRDKALKLLTTTLDSLASVSRDETIPHATAAAMDPRPAPVLPPSARRSPAVVSSVVAILALVAGGAALALRGGGAEPVPNPRGGGLVAGTPAPASRSAPAVEDPAPGAAMTALLLSGGPPPPSTVASPPAAAPAVPVVPGPALPTSPPPAPGPSAPAGGAVTEATAAAPGQPAPASSGPTPAPTRVVSAEPSSPAGDVHDPAPPRSIHAPAAASGNQPVGEGSEVPAVRIVVTAEPSAGTEQHKPAAGTAGVATSAQATGLAETPLPNGPLAEAQTKVAALHPVLSVPPDAPATAVTAPATTPAGSIVERPPLLDNVGDGGQRFKECSTCPEMIVLPKGSTMAGSPAQEASRQPTDWSPREISIATPFAVGRYQVTFEEWDACVAEGGCNNWMPGDFGWGRGRRPVIFVSWKDAQAFVAWLSAKTGARYRLLSEGEWEYAAKGCRSARCAPGPFWFGASIRPELANYDARFSYAGSPKAQAKRKTIPVDDGTPNPFGLVHVVGNVRVWTQDCWAANAAPLPDAAPRLTGDCQARVVRGGAWSDEPKDLRTAARSWQPIEDRLPQLGFRVARDLTP